MLQKKVVNVKQHVYEISDNQLNKEELDDIIEFLTTS